MRKGKVHQIYSSRALTTACGIDTFLHRVKTAKPGKHVTCKTCIKIEAARIRDREERKLLGQFNKSFRKLCGLSSR